MKVKVKWITLAISFFILSFYCLSFCLSDSKSLIWYDPGKESICVIQNRGWHDEIGNKYIRFPNRAKDSIRSEVWK